MTGPQEPGDTAPGVSSDVDEDPADTELVEKASQDEGELVEGPPIGVGSSEVGSSVVAAAARGGGQAQPIASLADADLADRTQDVQFKKIYGRTILGLVAGQLGLADLAFIWYAFAQGWDIEGYVMASWLSATVVQVVGLTWIVVRSLFPPEPPRPRQSGS